MTEEVTITSPNITSFKNILNKELCIWEKELLQAQEVWEYFYWSLQLEITEKPDIWDSSCTRTFYLQSRTQNNLHYVLSHFAYSFFKRNSIFIFQVSEGNVTENIHSVFH